MAKTKHRKKHKEALSDRRKILKDFESKPEVVKQIVEDERQKLKEYGGSTTT